MRPTAPVIVHLLAPDTPGGRLDVLDTLLRQSAAAATQLVFGLGGTPAEFHTCLATGTVPVAARRELQRVRAILPHDWFEARALRRALHQRRLLAGDRPVILHAWSAAAANWCRALPAGDRPLLIDVELGDNLRRIRSWSDAPCVGFACPSATAQRRLLAIEIASPRIVLARPAVDFTAFDHSNRGDIRRRLALDEQATMVLALPPVARRAGTFAVAWGTLLFSKTRPDIRLVIPAGGREQQRVHRLVEACRHEHIVRFAPPEMTLADLLAAADLAAYLPPGDSTAASLAWAMAAGRPIVSTRVPAVEELLSDGETARLCQPNDPADTARAMCAVLSDPAATRRAAQRARERAQDLFAESRMIAAYGRAYANLVARRPAGATAADPIMCG
jgi:glycosyltransferase involved in cell wall biosynthesis